MKRQHRAPPEGVAATWAAPTGWPLVGRDEELHYLRSALRTAGGAVLAGAAGVGKTRLARELTAASERRGTTVRWVTGTESSASMALGAFAGLVGDVTGDPAQILRAAMEALTASRARPDVLVCVDDAHHLDDLSAVLLLQLALQGRANVLVTVRSHQPAPSAVTALWSQGTLPRLDVQPLADHESAEVVTVALGGPVAPATATQLSGLARGNMLYLRQVIEGERAAGRLVLERDQWVWHGGFRPSDELTELIGESLAALPVAARQVLEVVSVAGPLPCDVLSRVCCSADIEIAERSGAVEADGVGVAAEVRPRHPLFGEVCRSSLGQVTAQRTRGEVAQALAVDGDAPAVLLRRAVLTLSSDLPPDPALLSAAAYHAIARLDWKLAQRLAEAAVGAGGGSEAELALAYALSFDLQSDRAGSVFAGLCQPGVVLTNRPRVVMSRAAHSFWYLSRTEEAKDLIATELAGTTDTGPVAALEAMLALFEVSSGELSAGLARVDRIGTAELSDPVGRLCRVWAEVAGRGFGTGIGDLFEAGWAAYQAAGGEFAMSQPRIGMAVYLVSALLLDGHVCEAERMAATVDAGVDVGLADPRCTAETTMALAALGAGQLRRSRELAAAAVAGLEGRDASGWVLQALLPYTTASALLGDRSAATDGCQRLVQLRHPAHALVEPDIRLAQAWTAACFGAVSTGVSGALGAAAWARDHGQPISELASLHVVVRLGEPSGHARIESLARELSGPRAPVVLAHARALAHDSGHELVTASRLLEDLGDRLGAADAAAQAAQAFARQGLRGSHAGAVARATRLQRECDGARTPALVAAVSPLPLTAREREIATLAARGLSNREIAEQLVVSVRTVEGHLYRAAGKVGVDRRAEFAALVE